MTAPSSVPTEDQSFELLLSCRYGDLEDVQEFIQKFGTECMNDIRDDNGNTVLHMVCGNGHLDILEYLLPLAHPTLLSVQNNAQSTPLHWAALNAHLPVVKHLVQHQGGPGAELIDIKNAAGLTPLGEAEKAGWEEGASWLVGVMKLDADAMREEEGGTDEAVAESARAVEVEIQDAEGGVARMTINRDGGEYP